MKDAVIDVEHLKVSFGKLDVLKDISFRIAKGEVFAILGGSGCGKSTLMRMIYGNYLTQPHRLHLQSIIVTFDWSTTAGHRDAE